MFDTFIKTYNYKHKHYNVYFIAFKKLNEFAKSNIFKVILNLQNLMGNCLKQITTYSFAPLGDYIFPGKLSKSIFPHSTFTFQRHQATVNTCLTSSDPHFPTEISPKLYLSFFCDQGRGH